MHPPLQRLEGQDTRGPFAYASVNRHSAFTSVEHFVFSGSRLPRCACGPKASPVPSTV